MCYIAPIYRSVVSAFALIVFMNGASAEDQARHKEAEEIVAKLIDVHPNADAITKTSAWTTTRDDFIAGADRRDEPAYLVSLLELLSVFEDGHTTLPIGAALSDGKFLYRLPLRFRVFDDGLFVTDAKDDAMAIRGGRVVSINDIAISDVMERFAAIWPADNVAWTQHDAGLLGLPALLAGLEILESETAMATIKVEFANGKSAEAILTPDVAAGADRQELPRKRSRQEAWANEVQETNYVLFIDDYNAIYLSLNEVGGSDTQPFEMLVDEVGRHLDAGAAEKIIIDLRRNAGGDNTLAERLRRLVATSSLNRPGGVIILIAPQTFSAAMNVAARFERDSFAVFIGGPTGASPNHFGDPIVYRGSETNLLMIISTLYWQDSTPFDQRDWIAPDVLASSTFQDWIEGRDEALDIALRYEPATEDQNTADWYNPWARLSQEKEWRPFWKR